MLTWLISNILLPLFIAFFPIAAIAIWGYFKSLKSGIFAIRDNHIPHLQASLDALPGALEKQTQAIVGSLQDMKKEIVEQRADIRNVAARL